VHPFWHHLIFYERELVSLWFNIYHDCRKSFTLLELREETSNSNWCCRRSVYLHFWGSHKSLHVLLEYQDIKNNWWSNCFDWYFFISWYSESIWKNLLQSHYLVILSPHLILELTTAMDALDMFFSVFLGNYNKGRSFTLHWLFSSLIFY
jgi:hypothetical protein